MSVHGSKQAASGTKGARQRIIGKAILSAAALATVAAVPAPAFAGGRGHHGYYRPVNNHYYYGGPYRGHYGYYDYRGYRHRHGRGNISGGEAALIAAGIIGGVILIDSALDNRARNDDRYYNRRYDDRRYDDRYDRRGAWNGDDPYYQRDTRSADDRYDDRYDGRYADRYDNRGDDRYRSTVETGNLDDALLGADNRDYGNRADDSRVLAASAFRECVAETRGAAGAGGMNVVMPGAPTNVETLADGSVRMTAQFRADNARGESWSRRFVCEADASGVRFLQVD